MRSLKVLCNDPGFSKMQKTHFKIEVDALLAESGIGKKGALFCLRRLWWHYDVGGHSMGRSPRSLILEQVMDWLGINGGVVKRSSMQKAKTALSVLVAMHYDYEYINRHNWYDYRLEAMWDLPMKDVIYVSAAALALDIDDIPSLDDWSNERIIAFLNGSEGG